MGGGFEGKGDTARRYLARVERYLFRGSAVTNPAWTPEDDERLRAFHATDLNAVQIATHFDGRTANGVKRRMTKLGLGLRAIRRARWTDAEYATLRRIWFEKGTLKALVAANLQHRGWRTAMEHGLHVLGLPPRGAKARGNSFSWVRMEMDRVLVAEPNLTVREITARCGGSRESVTRLLAVGHGEKYFRSGWENGRKTPRWSLGAGPDAEPEKAQTPTQINRRSRRRARVRAGRFDPFATLRQQVAA